MRTLCIILANFLQIWHFQRKKYKRSGKLIQLPFLLAYIVPNNRRLTLFLIKKQIVLVSGTFSFTHWRWNLETMSFYLSSLHTQLHINVFSYLNFTLFLLFFLQFVPSFIQRSFLMPHLQKTMCIAGYSEMSQI